jgi:enhanced entry protein EnhC|tara:strand:+ start:13003 stop:16074 length:3072 start_codon:yes stop_codon:yes gene_type:complete
MSSIRPITPWFCFITAVSAPLAYANTGIDAYRSGHYIQASDDLMHASKQGAVGDDYMGRMYLYGYGVLKNNQRALHRLRASAARGYLPAQKIVARYALIEEKNLTDALTWFKKAADQGDMQAQMYCAAAYRFGLGVRKSEDKARRYDIAAAKQGNSLAQASLAEHFLESRHRKNNNLGLIWVKRSAEQKEAAAQYLLGRVYAEGKLESQDVAQAKQLFELALAQGYVPAMRGLADLAKQAGDKALQKSWQEKADKAEAEISKNEEVLAARWLTGGKASTLTDSGYGLEGIFTAWNDPRALRQNQYNQPPQMAGISREHLYQPEFKLVEPNHIPLTDYYDMLVRSSADSEQKLMQENVDFITYPLAEEAWSELLEERASLGDPTAQFALGQLYQQGHGVTKDLKKAVDYYMQAVDQQDLQAEYTLGLFYFNGEDGQHDYQQALGWLNDAAFKGNPESQYMLGRLLERGFQTPEGEWVVKPNRDRAMSMYSLAAFNQHAKGEYRLAEILVRDQATVLSVQEKTKRHELMKRLYEGAANQGVEEAVLPLAFFDAMSNSKEKQEHAYAVAEEKAKSGSPEAALLLGMLFDRGLGVGKNERDAVYWYQQAKSNPVSAFILGTYYAKGHEVSQDKEEAAVLLRQASAAGFSYADLNMAVLEHNQGLDFLPNLEKAHALGNTTASLLLADYSLTGTEDTEHVKQARGIYQDLAERGDRQAQLKLGYLLEQGLGGTVNMEKAAHWYELAANQGHATAQYLLGRLNQLGHLGQQPNYALAKQWYSRAMSNYAPAAVALGFIHETVDDNYKQASIAYELAANKFSVIGEFDLGLVYEYGKGRPVDHSKAATLYKSAAERGHARAMVQLAGLYMHDENLRNYRKSAQWYRKAAKLGDRNAMYQLGYLAEKGMGVSQDPVFALSQYQASADQGDVQAILALARMHQEGVGTAQNSEKAAELYQILSEQDNGYAQYQLAMLYYNGALGDENKGKAKTWLKKAENNGCVRAQHALQKLNAETSENTSFIEPLTQGRG